MCPVHVAALSGSGNPTDLHTECVLKMTIQMEVGLRRSPPPVLYVCSSVCVVAVVPLKRKRQIASKSMDTRIKYSWTRRSSGVLVSFRRSLHLRRTSVCQHVFLGKGELSYKSEIPLHSSTRFRAYDVLPIFNS